MSYTTRFDIIDHTSPFFISETTIYPSPSKTPLFHPSLSLFTPHDAILDVISPSFTTPFDPFFTDLLQIESSPTTTTYKRLTRRAGPSDPSSYILSSISDRVSSLESRFDRLLALKERERKLVREADRKYTWTAEIKGGKDVDRKYKWTAEIEGDNVKKGKRGERKYQWSTELKGKDDDEKRIYTWKATIGGDSKKVNKLEKDKKKTEKKGSCATNNNATTRIVEIEEPLDHHRALILRQAFARRPAHDKGKRKELSPLDAAALIQMSFRAYLIRRSQALRALRELAVAKTKLKELRSLFHNFSYRSRVARDAEERQKFAEKIIVLLLTVDAIEGVDMMVRSAKRSMVDELEAMLDVVDPQPAGGRSLSMRRRTFDMPSGTIQKEIAEGVAQVVQMLDQENGTFEACL